MNNTFTKTKQRVYSLGMYAAALLMFIGFSYSAQAQSTNPSPYCGATHSNSNPVCQGTTWGGSFTKVQLNRLNFSGPDCASGHSRNSYSYWNSGNFPNLTTSLIKGSSYNLFVESGAYTQNTGSRMGAWIDWNGDNDFADAGEFIMQNELIPNQNNGGSVSVNTDVPCNAASGVTRMRIRISGFNNAVNNNNRCNNITWGETFDFDVTIDPPTNPTANFFIPDTVFTNSPANFINANSTGYIGHEWSTTVNGLNTIEVV